MQRLLNSVLGLAAAVCMVICSTAAAQSDAKKSGPADQIATALAHTKISLKDAIGVAAREKDTAGSILVGIELEEDKGHPRWVVALLKGDRVRNIAIDGVTGTSLGDEHGRTEPSDKGLDAARRIAAAGKMSVTRALDAAAPRIDAGRVYQISIKARKKSAIFEVNYLAPDSKMMQAQVDADTGEVLAIKPIGRSTKKSGGSAKSADKGVAGGTPAEGEDGDQGRRG